MLLQCLADPSPRRSSFPATATMRDGEVCLELLEGLKMRGPLPRLFAILSLTSAACSGPPHGATAVAAVKAPMKPASLGETPADPWAAFPNLEVELSHWGLTSHRDIGFASIGLQARGAGETRLVPYHLKTLRPARRASRPGSGKRPPLVDGAFVVSHFRSGNENSLGGTFNSFAKSPSYAHVALKDSPGDTAALGFAYRNVAGHFAGFSVQLFAARHPPERRVFVDARKIAYLSFQVRGEAGGERMKLQIADRRWQEKEDSLPIDRLERFVAGGKLRKQWKRAMVPLSRLPAGIERSELANLVFLVDEPSAGAIFIRDLAFVSKLWTKVPAPPASPPARTKKLSKGMWLWESQALLDDGASRERLVRFCRAQEISDLFMQLPYTAEKRGGAWRIQWDRKKMQRLLSALGHVGVNVHALDGDPRYALSEAHPKVLAMVRSVLAYNEEVGAKARFGGLRFDIEPYLLPGFRGVRGQAILLQYLKLLQSIRALTKAHNVSLGVDIPFWFDGHSEFYEPLAQVLGRSASEHIIDIVDNIGIMDYRTRAYGPDGLIVHAQDELAYAERRGKQVFIGLETVNLPDETIYQFAPEGEGGELWIAPLGQGRVRLSWVAADRRAQRPQVPEDAFVLKQRNATFVPASKLTFFGDQPAKLLSVMAQAAREMQRWRSFEGFVIHSYESYRPWLARPKKTHTP